MNATQIVIAAVVVAAVLAVVLVSAGLYSVSEMEYAVVTQFGRPVRTVTEAGLCWKNPFTQQVNRIEKRVLAWDGEPNDVLTQDKKNIFIDTWARWQVVDPGQFYISLEGRVSQGQKKLDDIVDGVVRDVIGRYELYELVRSTDRPLQYEIEDMEVDQREQQPQVKVGREKIVQEILQQAGADLEKDFGIRLLDVRIKRVNYIQAVRQSIYDRMISERSRISSRFLSEAEEQQNIILGDMQKELAVIEGEAAKQQSEVRGEADAKAIEVYAQAISQAPEFYEFLRTLQAYEKMFDKNTLVILSTDSQLLKLLKNDPGLEK